MSRVVGPNGVRKAFRLLRSFGIGTAAEIMVGMRRIDDKAVSDYEDRLKGFIKELDPDFVSLNVFSRRPGITATNPGLDHIESNENIYKTMAARINRNFYFHPKTLLRHLNTYMTPRELSNWLRIALHLLVRR